MTSIKANKSKVVKYSNDDYILQGVIFNHFVPLTTTVTGNYYATVIKSEL